MARIKFDWENISPVDPSIYPDHYCANPVTGRGRTLPNDPLAERNSRPALWTNKLSASPIFMLADATARLNHPLADARLCRTHYSLRTSPAKRPCARCSGWSTLHPAQPSRWLMPNPVQPRPLTWRHLPRMLLWLAEAGTCPTRSIAGSCAWPRPESAHAATITDAIVVLCNADDNGDNQGMQWSPQSIVIPNCA